MNHLLATRGLPALVKPGAPVVAVAALSLAACFVDQRCFRGSDCDPGQICGPEGLCVTGGLDPDGGGPITCPAEMANVADLFCVDLYEASRPDATATAEGSDSSAATSRKGVLPWQVSSNAAAAAACKAAGKRLCTPAEWQVACQGLAKTTYAYGDTYDKKICNGIDAFGPSKFHLAPTGSFPGCKNTWGAFDLNGNVWERVAGGSGMTVRGGAFNCGDSRTYHRCDYIPNDWKPAALGFRCCARGTPRMDDMGLESGGGDHGGAVPEGGLDARPPDAGENDATGDAPPDMATSGDAALTLQPDGSFCINLHERTRS